MSLTSSVEVTHISSHGVWLLSYDKELFMSYDEFPWFKDQPVKIIINVEELVDGHFYWPELDVDITLEMIEHLERFPLKDKIRTFNPLNVDQHAFARVLNIIRKDSHGYIN